MLKDAAALQDAVAVGNDDAGIRSHLKQLQLPSGHRRR